MNIFVIGNGESRRGFDLNQLKGHGTIIGCNALYRDFKPDLLVAVDRPILGEICASGYADNNRVYVRQRFYNEYKHHMGINVIPTFWGLDATTKKFQAYQGWSSGPSAVALATSLYDDNDLPCRVFLIGFDMFGLNDKVNNMYKGTPHYVPDHKPATFYGNWGRQLTTVFQTRTDITFIKLGYENTMRVPGWWENFKHIEYDRLDNIEKYFEKK